jgi:glycosyltransferase involved in cell wall biosynthesis
MKRFDNRLSICIVAHNSYGAISGGHKGFIGGVEWQTSLLARWMAERGHRVVLVTWDEGGPSEENIDGVQILKICPQKAGLPGVRFFYPKWSGLWRVLREADANVYYHNCGECVTGQVALWCQRHRRGFVFSLASDADCNEDLPELHSVRERFLYRLGLRKADRVIAQTLTQKQRLERSFGVASEVIPMPCLGPSHETYHAPEPTTNRVLWIGRVCQVKRPDRLFELAARCPEMQFDLVGPLFDDAVSKMVRERAMGVRNVTVHGQVPKKRLPEFYQRASFLCCTSDYEGFPNTFLEAWSYGLPIISTFDPDGIISARGLGVVANEVPKMVSALRDLSKSPKEYAAISCRSRDYFTANHTLDAVMPRFERVLIEASQTAHRAN